jgi:hypothetical protein
MIFRIVAPFCTTLTHFKPPRHLVGQPFSEKKLKKVPTLGGVPPARHARRHHPRRATSRVLAVAVPEAVRTSDLDPLRRGHLAARRPAGRSYHPPARHTAKAA